VSSNLKDLRQFLGSKDKIDGQDLIRILDAIENHGSDIERRISGRLTGVNDAVKAIQSSLQKVAKKYPLPVEDIGGAEVRHD